MQAQCKHALLHSSCKHTTHTTICHQRLILTHQPSLTHPTRKHSACAASKEQRQATDSPLPSSAKPAFLTAWAASGVLCYTLLSGQELPEVPPLFWKVCSGAAAAAVGTPLLLKLVLQDRFHVELHRNRLYFQLLQVPPTGNDISEETVEVRPTGDVRGNGAFVVKPILKGQHVCDYEGEVIDRDTYFDRYPSGASDYVMRIDDEYAKDAIQLVQNTARFSACHMNHSRSPNVSRFYSRREGRVSFYALRDISVGEELTIDYGRDFWLGREEMEIP